jgi:hypothetical protein
VKYEHHDPTAAVEGPTREAILLQIEADHDAAKGDRGTQKMLNQRYGAVSAAATDEEARVAYAAELATAIEAEAQTTAQESAEGQRAMDAVLAEAAALAEPEPEPEPEE